jgi:NAD(P)-dependent dehydrogenase (short-subunit alcohol dehydrogenase family)
MFSLDGRRALVTGGSSGIGAAMGAALADAGAEVVLEPRGAARLEEAASATAASWIAADLAERAEVARVAGEVGDVDVLVHAAALNVRPPLGELAVGDWDRQLELNLTAPFLLGQRLGPPMAARGWGRIVHVGSQQSWRAFFVTGQTIAVDGGFSVH